VVIFDAGSKVTYQNPIHLKLVGNHLGESCRAAYLDGGHDCTDCAVARVRAEGTVQRKERRILVDGQAVFLETTAAPIRNAGGEIVSVIEIVRDISERRRAEEALRESEARYSSLFQNNHATMLLVDPATGEIVDANPAAAEFYGYSRDRLIGKNISEINSLSEEEILQEMQKARQDRRRQFYFRHRLASGEVRDIEVFSGPIQVQGRELLFSLIHDVTERKMAEDRVQYQAFHDALTGLPNRALLEDRLQQTLVRAVRHAEPGAIFFLDLDRFKVINDSLGHHAGDQLLVGVGEGLTATLRTGDTVCRHGGDEFILLLPQVKNAADAAHVAEKIQKLFSRHFSVAGREIFVSPSIGISLYPADGSDIPTLIKNADAAMYLAKERGRNNYQFFKPELTIAMHERLALENDLRQALAKNELLLHYQPQIDTATQKLVGVEALVRWQHPRLGLVMPDRFIPIAEETGLIEQLGEWVLRTACAQGKVWQESGFVPLRIAVNVSSRQFGQPDFPAVVGRVLEEAGLDSRWLELEVTENIIMEHVEKTVAILADLKRRGISLAIDDFGTGYSSLNYLRQFPIDRLKIDRSFIADITTNPDDAAIASAVISLAKSLNLAVVAEGVETTEQVQFLLERGCDEIQGYLFARPAPAEALLPYMEPQKDSKNRVLAAQGQEGGRAFGWN
jgi:diguanylate cyclase (GGDEF)-like protein/PAS domain S-box-containing protein